MNIPLLGEVQRDNKYGWLISEPIASSVLGDKKCRFVLEGYEKDPRPQEFHTAIANFLNVKPDVLQQASEPLYQYFEDIQNFIDDEDCQNIPLSAIWNHVELGDEVYVERRHYGDRGIYVSVTCECEWEPEHGLQLVFKNGERINKLGPYDGHLTNSDAYDDPNLEEVIYKRVGI